MCCYLHPEVKKLITSKLYTGQVSIFYYANHLKHNKCTYYYLYLYSVAKLFLIKRIEDTKYIPIISDKNRTTLLEDPLPTLETAKKNCMQPQKWKLGFITSQQYKLYLLPYLVKPNCTWTHDIGLDIIIAELLNTQDKSQINHK